ncbi:hypothetical protein FA13DRAFT_1624509 [Coprinellus micaceus]|uniref:SWIM-type domain-containing protein n=1 Tax=Coprinellus micaceus TaxID=71717 RepID=A0A4Y7TNL9_COPMI|nr:hypothetical protein FA13DRAFT_1624509 [Coprinellus micaceus]
MGKWRRGGEFDEYLLGDGQLTSEVQNIFNDFTNDLAYLATPWLLRLITAQGHIVDQLVKVIRESHGVKTTHILALLANGGYVCDCTMGLNMGIPCRHFFAVLRQNTNLTLRMNMIAKRWYKNQNLDTESMPQVSASEIGPALRPPPSAATQHPKASLDNPLQPLPFNPEAPPSTRTLPAREVYSEAQAAIGPIVRHIQTQDDLDHFVDALQDYR